MLKANQGFTLLELSIVVMISGFMTASVAYLLSNNNLIKSRDQTIERLETLNAAFTEFKSTHGRYPCPAPLDTMPGDVNHGIESCATAILTSGRDADGDGFDDPVLIGAVPYKTMVNPDNNALTEDGVQSVSLPEAATLDGWGRKFTYAVTQRLTVPASFVDELGAIIIVDEHNNDTLDPPGSAHIAFISHGPNGSGGYTRRGDLATPCGTLPPAPPPGFPQINEAENCNNDGKFLVGLTNTNDIYTNDDISRYYTLKEINLWRFVSGTQIVNANPGYVGIGQPNPTSQFDIDGDLSTDFIYTKSFCDQTGYDCMDPQAVGGNLADMACPTGYGVTAINENKVTCSLIFSSPVVESCPLGQFVIGISNKTGLICATP